MEYHAIGMNFRHDGEFCIDRPHGSGDNLLLIFKTGATVFLNGKEISVSPDSAIIYSKGKSQHYCTCGRFYVNHFLHMDCDEDTDFHRTSGVKFDTLIQLSDVDAVEEILRMISREAMSVSPHKNKYMELLIKMMILKIADSSGEIFSPSEKSQHSRELNALRAEIYSNAGQFGSIDELARKMNLSASHFQQLYRSQFGISCYDDLLTARMKTAQYYLRSSNLAIKEIAILCGYENDVCFMRRFKQRTGKTPLEYRNLTMR